MSKLTTKIRSIVGKGKTEYGQGMMWMTIAENGRSRSTNEAIITKLSSKFKTYKVVKNPVFDFPPKVFYVFEVTNRNGVLGYCQVEDWDKSVVSRNVIIDISEEVDNDNYFMMYKSNSSVANISEVEGTVTF